MASRSIFSRKKDLIYLVFFLTHLPVMLAFDLTSYYPTSLKPSWMTEIRTWYHLTYGDRFFSAEPPPWFPLFILLELVLHIPLTLYLISALLHDAPRTPLALLVFGLETSVTTATCLAEMLSWGELSSAQRGVQGLGGMYGGYLAVGLFMTVDAYARLDQILAREKGLEPVTKKDL
ncbi:hypothetical protein EJ04DRAFT_544212 [Polyplosphaeria fusca]|uniref:Efficient mitochondria targeting-associated protein 19 n=1 Tax=Polyplosphaeria fusca TaxID=682080 RepID=A0A9P4QT02_9PLEO|nr:hypothetical protein EJ04DRAFT_544212 [Polyplosphaeria fusca]